MNKQVQVQFYKLNKHGGTEMYKSVVLAGLISLVYEAPGGAENPLNLLHDSRSISGPAASLSSREQF